jgi:hypothetical protein
MLTSRISIVCSLLLFQQSVGEFTMNLPNTLIFGLRDGLYGAAVDNAVSIWWSMLSNGAYAKAEKRSQL